MKQQLISAGLAVADSLHAHPKRIAAVVAALLLGSGGGAYAVASFAPAAPTSPLRLVSESVQPADALAPQADLLDAHPFTLYRSEQVRATDTPEALLKRLGLADPAAAAFLRKNATVRQVLFNRAGRTVTAEANDRLELQALRTRWIDADAGDNSFKRLVVERAGDDFSVRIETAPLAVSQRIAGGVIRSTLYGATDEANLPDGVTKQLIQIFDSSIDFHRGLRKGDRFSIVYETLEADGEPLRAGKILSAEFVNRGKSHDAIWFKEAGAAKGDYYSPDGQSLHEGAYLASPLAVSRLIVTSGFGMRLHPLLGYSRMHTGVDYGAPIGTPVRAVGDGTVQFAGKQHGYGNVIYIRHRNQHDTTVYAHLSHIGVKVGEKVSQGETIGAVGMTGLATGPHLHFEYRVDNHPRNPVEMLAEHQQPTPMSPANQAAFAKVAADMKTQLADAGELTQTRGSFE